jgi:hypothetical protein
MTENHPHLDRPRPSVLDDAIDRAVRQMVQVDPPSGLRRRVLSRLALPATRSEARVRYMAAAAATLAMLIVAAGLLVRDRTPVATDVKPASVVAGKQQGESTKAAPRAYQTPLASKAGVPGAGPTPARVRRAPHAEVIPIPEVTNVFGPPANTIAGASVSARESDTVEPRAETISARPLEIQDLTIVPLDIEPLRIPEIAAAERRR